MRYVYPAVFHPEIEGGFSVFFPDVGHGATQGETTDECVSVAEDFLCSALYWMEESKQQIPEPSDINSIQTDADDIVTLISVDTEKYRDFY